MGPHHKALDEGVRMVPLDYRYTKVGFSLVSVQVCDCFFFVCVIFHGIYGRCVKMFKSASGQLVVCCKSENPRRICYNWSCILFLTNCFKSSAFVDVFIG